jgi:SAM-dependent methyltransferase
MRAAPASGPGRGCVSHGVAPVAPSERASWFGEGVESGPDPDRADPAAAWAGRRRVGAADGPAFVTTAGDRLDLGAERWWRPADTVDRAVLAAVPDPVLDVGCGPGRIVAALAGSGRMALGVDPSPMAFGHALRHGAPVLRRSVFGPLPGEGRWSTVVLFDGNVGIGGDPVALLRRCAALVRAGGRVVAELQPPGAPSGHLTVRLAVGADSSPWFPWARVAADRAADLAARAGLTLVRVKRHGDRWFAEATR